MLTNYTFYSLYDTIGIGKVYRKQLSKESVDVLRGRRLPSGVFVREGFQKGVRLVDPSNPTPAIVIDGKWFLLLDKVDVCFCV